MQKSHLTLTMSAGVPIKPPVNPKQEQTKGRSLQNIPDRPSGLQQRQLGNAYLQRHPVEPSGRKAWVLCSECPACPSLSHRLRSGRASMSSGKMKRVISFCTICVTLDEGIYKMNENE